MYMCKLVKVLHHAGCLPGPSPRPHFGACLWEEHKKAEPSCQSCLRHKVSDGEEYHLWLHPMHCIQQLFSSISGCCTIYVLLQKLSAGDQIFRDTPRRSRPQLLFIVLHCIWKLKRSHRLVAVLSHHSLFNIIYYIVKASASGRYGQCPPALEGEGL